MPDAEMKILAAALRALLALGRRALVLLYGLLAGTFGGAIGDCVVLQAEGGVWYEVGGVSVVLTEA